VALGDWSKALFTDIALKRPLYYHAKMKLEDISDKANFVKYMSSQVFFRNWPRPGKCFFDCCELEEMNESKVLAKAREVGMEQKVIVFLVDKLFKRIFNNKPLWTAGVDQMVGI
jgi:hypothetical protein